MEKLWLFYEGMDNKLMKLEALKDLPE